MMAAAMLSQTEGPKRTVLGLRRSMGSPEGTKARRHEGTKWRMHSGAGEEDGVEAARGVGEAVAVGVDAGGRELAGAFESLAEQLGAGPDRMRPAGGAGGRGERGRGVGLVDRAEGFD